jgi:hypothetical protein
MKKAVKFVCLDNAGENKKLKEWSESADWRLNINYEFTAQDTPQQNHLTELGFAGKPRKSPDALCKCDNEWEAQDVLWSFQDSYFIGWTDSNLTWWKNETLCGTLEWQATRLCKAFGHLGQGWNS